MPLTQKSEIDFPSNDIMAHIKDDCDASVAKEASLDWGGDSMTSVSEGPSSRYDPKAMSRIVDITDLVDDDDHSSDDDDIMGHNSSNLRNSTSSRGSSTSIGNVSKKRRGLYGPAGVECRQVMVLVSLVGIIAAASVAIGYAVMNGDPTGNGKSPIRSGSDGNREQELLEMAERVVTACAESKLDESMKECQKLCRSSMCCFEDGDYSCADDEKKDCAVYGGCVNLMEGIPLGGAEEDEE